MAAPLICIGSIRSLIPYIRTKSSIIFSEVPKTATIIGIKVFCSPLKTPNIPMVNNVNGNPKILILK